jgi:hypothetical protein
MLALLLEFSKQWDQWRSLIALPLKAHEVNAACIDYRAVNMKYR